MITNARVFQEEFVPSDVEHRHREIEALSNTFEPLVRDEPAGNAFCFGPTGAGKTCVARYTLTRLREQLLDLDTQYVNCWEDHTRFQTLYRLLDALQPTHDIHRQSTPQDELVRRLRESIDHPYVVVLDEVDQLADKSLLYELDRIPHLYLLFISNREEDVFGDVDERIHSRLTGARRVQFDRYTVDQLTAILASRVEEGFEPGSVSRDQLAYIADAAAGDARIGIKTLRTAARRAASEGYDAVPDDVVEAAVPQARASIRQKTIETLTRDQRVLYDIVVDEGEIAPGDLYAAYRDEVADPKTERTLRNYLSKLQQYNLIETSGNTRGRTYSAIADRSPPLH